jgi:hypothetical protein
MEASKLLRSEAMSLLNPSAAEEAKRLASEVAEVVSEAESNNHLLPPLKGKNERFESHSAFKVPFFI